jgi:outer membrane protein OmpA-like peptidoglycan-associated protein
MIIRNFFYIIFFVSISTSGQEVQWAARVIDFSSELSSKEYSAQQVIGKPNALPQGGDSPNAWLPLHPNKMAHVVVGFDNPIRAQQIIIAESYNPSATYQIFLYDRKGEEYLLNTFSPKPIPQNGRLLHLFFEKTNYDVVSLKLVLDGLSVPGYNGIDAIGVSDSRIPVEIKVIEAQHVSNELNSEKLSHSINSEYKEIRPILTPDGQTMYFSRKNHPENIGGLDDPEDIWYSNYDNEIQEWLEAINAGEPLNNKGANFISSITPDGKSLTVILGNKYHRNKDMKPGVSISTRSSTGWSEPVPVNINNAFIENSDGHYFLTQNRETMIMAVKRLDSYGGKDIYVTFLLPDGSWTEPLNLGDAINTSSDEDSPFLAADNETLYFSSKGYSGFGGYDIYISRRLDDSWKSWSEPENLGRKLNTEEDEMFFTIPPSGDYAYYSKSNTELDADIYKIQLPIFFQPEPVAIMKGHIYRQGTDEPVSARITYDRYPDETEVGYTRSDTLTGEYEIIFPLGSVYSYTVDIEGTTLLDDTLNLTEQENYVEIDRDLYVDPSIFEQAIASAASTPESGPEIDTDPFAAIASVIEINDGVLSIDVHFSFDSDVIWKVSYQHLDKIINLLKSAPVEIIIAGHTDSIGSTAYNQYLSERRAISVEKYFIDKGIDPDKLQTIGYGLSRPIKTNETTDGRQQNRRVEFIRADEMHLYDQKYNR